MTKSEIQRAFALRKALLDIFFTESIGDCYVNDAVEWLLRLENRQVAPVLGLVRLVAYSVSEMLAFSLMENAASALEVLTEEQLEEWVTEALNIYERAGLVPAREFLGNVRETGLRFCGQDQVAVFSDSARTLRLLSAGISGRSLLFRQGDVPGTDTRTVYGPGTCAIFSSAEDNHLFYRVMVVHKCAQVRYHSFLLSLSSLHENFPALFHGVSQAAQDAEAAFSPDAGSTRGCASGPDYEPGIVRFLKVMQSRFPQHDIPALYCLVDTIRVEHRLKSDFPGLGRYISQLKYKLRGIKSHSIASSSASAPLILWILDDYEPRGPVTRYPVFEGVMKLASPSATALDSARVLYSLLESGLLKDESRFLNMLPYVGSVNSQALANTLLDRRMEVEKSFVEIAALLLSSHGAEQKKLDNESPMSGAEQDKGGASGKDQAAAGVPPVDEQREATDSHVRELLFLASDQDTAQQFSDLVREIIADMGAVPSSYVSSALDAATGVYDSRVEAGSAPDAAPLFTFYSYDEWDFRRGAYRKKWCTVREVTPPPVRGTLVEQVLAKYRGQVASLRRQFELMRQECRTVRRQKDGDEIDIDAVVEAWADFQAGSMPSENLFTRLLRDNRDIAVLFLVDMSASTEGWINTAIKESLVLLTQAMELLNDRYAIYGFSGMQRTGCQYYVIKEFSEDYDEEVEGRITGINARDYTRMGPAIRHSIEKLMEVDSRLRILLTLSDGRPEDYDEYKGPYAIEDTRRALFEAREYGIRPFCITIDSEAREYLPRLYGAANYILVPDVRLLHRRVPEIYRLLTT